MEFDVHQAYWSADAVRAEDLLGVRCGASLSEFPLEACLYKPAVALPLHLR